MAEPASAPFGALLKRYRLAAGLTQEQLAARAGLSTRAVSDLERDPARQPRLESVALLADALALADAERRALRVAARPVCTPAAPPAPVAAVGPDPRARPATRYARSGDVSIAYQVVGDGPVDLVLGLGFVSHLEYAWEEPGFAHYLRRLAAFARLITFDKRGTGLSDRGVGVAPLDERMDDVRAVMDAARAARAVLLGASESGPLMALFAATYPERVAALVLYGTFASAVRAPDYPWRPAADELAALIDARARTLHRTWGTADAFSVAGDPAWRHWFGTYLRLAASPGAAVALMRMNATIDIRHVLPTIRVPTLVLHRTDDPQQQIAEGRYVAAHIPGARFVALPSDTHHPYRGDTDALVDEVEAFVTGVRPATPSPPAPPPALLTRREREVLPLVARGLTNRQIADALSIGERTVESHVASILARLGVANRVQLAPWASAVSVQPQR
jgi:pimeloyl-ACP methyl ester carboxylesterase/DNA-binding CsgD family transcriptional regulator/transcriptional regulator with XRE-family HTH domain